MVRGKGITDVEKKLHSSVGMKVTVKSCVRSDVQH